MSACMTFSRYCCDNIGLILEIDLEETGIFSMWGSKETLHWLIMDQVYWQSSCCGYLTS